MNSKGFGGNNATSAMISADLTRELLERRYGQKEMSSWKDKKENTSKMKII